MNSAFSCICHFNFNRSGPGSTQWSQNVFKNEFRKTVTRRHERNYWSEQTFFQFKSLEWLYDWHFQFSRLTIIRLQSGMESCRIQLCVEMSYLFKIFLLSEISEMMRKESQHQQWRNVPEMCVTCGASPSLGPFSPKSSVTKCFWWDSLRSTHDSPKNEPRVMSKQGTIFANSETN
jgi:hypothetical protein